MKKSVLFLFIVCLFSILYAQNRMVSLSEAKSVADRNAHALWGINLGSATPIPYYGPDDTIIAWHFNYSINKPFPDAEQLKLRCDQAHLAGNRKLGNGDDDYFNIVVGANRDMPVSVQSAKCLSQQFTLGKKLERVAAELFPKGYEIVKTYYLGYANVWYQVRSADAVRYINMLPYPKILSQEEYDAKVSKMTFFWERDEFEEDWVKFLDRSETFDRSEVWIPGEENMPFYEWSYGCAPTAAAMHMAWYDHNYGAGRIIDYHVTRFDSHINETQHHVPRLQSMLATEMGTDSEGSTDIQNVEDGYEELFDYHGYGCLTNSDYSPVYTSSHYFDNVKNSIDAGIPIYTSIPEHGICGVGYISSPAQFHAHDSNHSTVQTLSRSQLDGTVEVYVTSGEFNNYLEIISPNGDTGWDSAAGNGETLYSGDIYPIRWSSNTGTYVKIIFNDDGGSSGRWVDVTSYIPNTGSYDWVVPAINHPIYGNNTPLGRIRIVTYNDSYYHLASDGSYGNFNIIGGVGMPVLISASEPVTTSPDYFTADFYESNTWGVVGIKDSPISGFDIWRMELYDSPSFTNMVEQADPDDLYNYIVINNRQLAPNEWGVKLYSSTGAPDARAELSGNLTLSLVNGNNTGLAWNSNDVVRIYNVYLSTGSYMFNMNIVGSSADLDFALYKGGGDGIFKISDAVAASRGSGLGTEGSESMYYTVTEAGWYGLCVSTRTDVSCMFSINITPGGRWTGTVSNVWHNAANWAGNVLPTSTSDILIPANCTYYPRISSVDGNVKSLTIASGATLTVADGTLNVYSELRIYGGLYLTNASSVVNALQDVVWEAGATASMASTAVVYCNRHWTFQAGSSIGFTSGYVYFTGSSSSRIVVNSADSYFWNLRINKATGAYAVFNELSQQNLVIKNNLYTTAGSIFKSNSDKFVVLEGTFTNNGNFQFDAGTFMFMGSTAYLSTSPGDYFHSIYFMTTQAVQLISDLHLNGDLTIDQQSGNLSAGSYDIYIGGDWKNPQGENGFVEGTGTVIFNGEGDQMCYGETFNKLELANPNCNLIFHWSNSSCNSYQWTAGNLKVQDGTQLTIHDLANNGIYGGITVREGGVLDITQDSSSYTDLCGSIVITGGYMTIRGGFVNSVWGRSMDTRIQMSGGVLDFATKGINIIDSPYLVSATITGGTIRTVGDFICARNDFAPQGGTLEMYGTSDNQIWTSNALGLNLIINKANSRANTVTLTSNLTVLGSVIVESGTLDLRFHSLNVEDELEISGNLRMTDSSGHLSVANNMYWNATATSSISGGSIELGDALEIQAGASFQLGAGNTFKFLGVGSHITNNAAGSSFGNVILVTGTAAVITFNGPEPMNILGNLTIETGAYLNINGCYLNVNGYALANIDSNMEILSGGRLTVAGNFSTYGQLLIEDASLVCNDYFGLSSGANMDIRESGSCILQKPYAALSFILNGTVNIGMGSTLEITHNGLQIGSTRNISMTGGTIKIGQNFLAINPNTFWGENGTVEFIGARTASIQMGSGNYFNHLVFNKPSVGYAGNFLSDISIENDLTIQGGNPTLNEHTLSVGRDLIINGGRLTAGNTNDLIQVGRNWFNNVGVTAFEEGSGTVSFFTGATPYASIISTETFNYLNINKTPSASYGVVQTMPGTTVTVNNILNANTGELLIGENAILRTDSNVNVHGTFKLGAGSTLNMNHTYIFSVASGGVFMAMGSPARHTTLTSDRGYYAFNVDSGGSIAAQNSIFDKMNANGINITSGATINPSFSFNYCTFQNGEAGGTLLRKNNSQDITVTNAVFPTNNWSGSYNVYHNPAAGSINFMEANGGFHGAVYENDSGNRITWTNVSPNPTIAHSPLPVNDATEVLTTTLLQWEYTSSPDYADPIGYTVKMGTDPNLVGCLESYKVGGPGTHLLQPLLALVAGTTYYWQIIPTTEAQGSPGATGFASSDSSRGDAANCPIWSFTTAGSIPAITVYPYTIEFENGTANWTSGAISGSNNWELGFPTMTPMNTTHSGMNAWVTYLSQVYDNNANTWLMSPPLNFNNVSAPNLSVWLHINCEAGYDGMILESSLDSGSSWQKVNGDTGFYNYNSNQGPIQGAKWSGLIGNWAQYSTSLPGLGNQGLVYLRFRFGSDYSLNYQGMAVDDIRIWDANAISSFTWSEDFTGIAPNTLPAGWTSTHSNWSVQSTSHAGGTDPEIVFNYAPYTTDNFYLKSPLLDTSGNTQLTLSYKQSTDHYDSPYTLKLMSIVGTTEYLIREWVNPLGTIPAETVTHTLTAASHGVGAINLQLAWVFSGYSYNINSWYLDDISLSTAYPYPTYAHTPDPVNGATLVPVTTGLGWIYTTNPEYPDPIGYKLRYGTSPTMASYNEIYTSGGPGTYSVTPNTGLAPATSYYWQVITTTEVRSNSPETAFLQSSADQRSDATGCPIWSFTTTAAQPITSFPYTQQFESGASGWYGGAVVGNNHWQVGAPAQTTLGSAHSGTKAWMTFLNTDYENNANTWLKSPPLDFSLVTNPKLSVWLNVWCESGWDGMILESSIDGGSSWQYVSGEAGFYSPGTPQGPITVPKWSGMNGAWVQYSTALAGLANQGQVYLRFRFASDDSGVYEGIALDDIQIWNEEIPPAVAHTPIPANNATGVSINTQLAWTYTTSPGQTDPVAYIIKGGTDPLLNSYDITNVNGGPGTYSIPIFFDVSYGGTYYWQVIPTTDSFAGFSSLQVASSHEPTQIIRIDAQNCPIWSFTVETLQVPISAFPYHEDFEAGQGDWNGGAITGANHWQYGTPAQTIINTAHSGTNAWMTYLSQNYSNNANTWLLSPLFDFSGLSNPIISVWINQWSEADYDGMILESSLDGGTTWQYVSGSSGFYNSSLPLGPIAAPKWSGQSGIWTEYSTTLTGLAYQSPVSLRFRFASDENNVFEGMAVDDISIFNSLSPVFAVTPSSSDFGTLQIGHVSEAQEFLISNLGLGTISIAPADIQIRGVDADEFILTNLSQAVNLGSGQSVSVSASFAPLTDGNKMAFLQIDDHLGAARALSITRPDMESRACLNRELHQIPLLGTSLAPPLYTPPLTEDFSRTASGFIPENWECTHTNWSVQSSSEAGGILPELVFSALPTATGGFYFKSPRIDTSGMSQVSLSFKHRVIHNSGNYTLKIVAIVGTTEYLIQQWNNPATSIPAAEMQYTLNSASHGVGAADLRIAWILEGNSANINAWHIDDISLAGIAPTVVTGNATCIITQGATLQASINNTGSTSITAKGFYYSTVPNPVLMGTMMLSDSPGNDFTALVTGLPSGTDIYYCAFATNSIGTAYGNELSFMTAIETIDAPQNLTIEIQNGTRVLYWSAVTNANSYRIYRSWDPHSLDWGAPVAITVNPEWTDTLLGSAYFYKVTASTEGISY